MPGIPDVPDADDVRQAAEARINSFRLPGRSSFGSLGGYAQRMPGVGSSLMAFFFFSFVGKLILVLAIAWLGWSWLTGELTSKERLAWEAAVGKKQAVINARVNEVEAGTKVSQSLAKQHMSRADAIYKLVERGIWKVEKIDPVEAATVDLINETRGEADAETVPIN